MTLRSGEIFFSEQSEGIFVPESISLFGLSISFYGFFLVLAAVIGLFATVREARRKKQNVEWYLTLLAWSIVTALIGARVYYVMFQWHLFVQNPLELFNLRSGGLSYFGALLGVWMVVKWYCRRKGESFIKSADVLSVGASAAAPLIWLGCVFVREPLGRFCEGGLSMRIETEYLPVELAREYSETLVSNIRTIGNTAYVSTHPVSVYGILFSVVLFVVLWFYKRKTTKDGNVFILYLLFNAVSVIILEFFRADRCYLWGTKIPANYVVGGVIIFVIVFQRIRINMAKGKKKNFFRNH